MRNSNSEQILTPMAVKAKSNENENKVYLLNYTIQFLKKRYPEVTPFVTLKFDDERQDLELKSVT